MAGRIGRKGSIGLEKASCVIIGGGVMGCSTAYHLAQKRVRDVILLEKEFIASRATGICPGGIRQQWSSKLGCLLSKASVEFFRNLDEELHPDFPLPFIQSGYLFLAYSGEVLGAYRKNVAFQNTFGIPSEILSAEQIRDLIPSMNITGILGGAYCGEDGYLEDCSGFTNSLASRARSLGVRVIYDEATGILLKGDRVVGVKGKKDVYGCETIINVAGCDAAPLAASIGIHLPIVVGKRRLLYTQRVEDHFLSPCLASLEKGWGGKQLHEGHVYMAYIAEEAEKLSNMEFVERSVELGTEIIPRLGETRIHRLQEGYYDITPDDNPILGKVEGLDGYFHAVGFSGHGFMLSPAVGKAMAQLISGEKPFVDLTDWSLNRFRKGVTRKESLVL
jgi:sarcosine oxidase subunit beta